ncbi:MAG: bifunctional riboflavin kinase/FAD synthetase [Spirochaetia bacterium]|nr:bifunctional riboflavin kinase/FAD synthetase [Spirochaetia bacterium]
MQIISDLEGFSPNWKSCALTLGDFDGFHQGHRALISRMIAISKENKVPAVLLTYDPSPKKVLQKLKFDTQIYTREEKIILLQNFLLRASVFLPFSKRLSLISAADFLENILLDSLHAKYILVGYDHHFGHNRKGNFEYLLKESKKYKFKTETIKPMNYKSMPISSSLIRNFLKNGEIEKANILLQAPFFIMSTVIVGKQRGLGIPTANLHISPEKLLPKEGVYQGVVLYGGKKYKAVVNIGFNPTFSNIDLSIEAHIIDFSENIYGQTIQLYFLKRLREEKKFINLSSLKSQIEDDIKRAKTMNIDMF